MAITIGNETFKSWDELTELEQLACQYSDYYKDAHGFRPRGDVSTWTVEDFKKEFEYLGKVCEANEIARNESEAHAAAEFEKTVTRLIGTGAKDRETAIRWLADAEGCGDDREYLCYCLGLPYGYFKAR